MENARIAAPQSQSDLVGGQEGEQKPQQDAGVLARARKYIAKVPGAVSGEGGHFRTFHVALRLVDMFELEPEDAWLLLVEYNWRCEPPWAKAQLVHKLCDAFLKVGVELCEAELNANFEFPSIPPTEMTSVQRAVDRERVGSEVSHLNWPTGAAKTGIDGKPILHGMRLLTDAEMCQLSQLRKIPIEGIRLAAKRGFLFGKNWYGNRCFGVKDRSGRLIELRRMDGQYFSPVPECGLPERKSHAVKHSNKAWPLGILEAGDFSHIALVEGIPDFLYAHGRAVFENAQDRVAVVGMLTSSPDIYDAACFFFADKTVRIFAHMDAAGLKAAERWRLQLSDHNAAKVDIFDLSGLKQLDGKPVGDLCDLTNVTPEQLEADSELRLILP